MDFSYLFALLAGFGYAVAAIFSKRATQLNCGALRLAFVINWVFVPVFALLFLRDGFRIPAEAVWWQPVATGALFFLGQIFTFTAIRVGDVSLHTPIMGTKAVFVVLLAAILGTEPVTAQLWVAAVLSALGVGLLGFSGGGVDKVWLTIALALLSSFFFAGSDTMVGHYGSGFGTETFLFIAILVNAVLSCGLIPFFRGPLRFETRAVLGWALLAGLFMGLQAVVLNFTLSHYQNVGPVNILYSTRGLWSILLAAPLALVLAIPAERLTRGTVALRLVGALLMCAAVGIVLG